MIEENTLHLFLAISGIAATFAGFGGVVAVFGRRAHGEWLPEELLRLANMLVMSLMVCFFSLIPLIVDLFHPSYSTLWTFSSILLCGSCIVYFFHSYSQMKIIQRSRPKALKHWVAEVIIIFVGSAILLQVLNASGLAFARGPGPYATALLLLLNGAGLQFVMLILEPFKYEKNHEKIDDLSPPIRLRK